MSLFDKPKVHLSVDVFTKQEKMKSAVREHIFSLIQKAIPEGVVSAIYFIGSMAGRQYNEESDIDINIILKPLLSRDDYKEPAKLLNGTFLPGTNHPINFYVANYSPKENMVNSDYAVYDMIEDK